MVAKPSNDDSQSASQPPQQDTIPETRIPTGPIVIDWVLMVGASYHGVPVSRVELVLLDERRIIADLPLLTPEKSGKDRLSVMQRRIYDLFSRADPDHSFKSTEIARYVADDPQNPPSVSAPLAEMRRLEILYAKQGLPGFTRGKEFDSYKS